MAIDEHKTPAKLASPPSRGGAITALLKEGFGPVQIAKMLKAPHQNVLKHIKKLERDGLVQRISTRPTFFKFFDASHPHLKPVGYSHPPKASAIDGQGGQTPQTSAIILPHKLGAIFALTGKPPLKFNDRGKATLKEQDHTAQFGRHKAQIWLKAGFQGIHPDDILANARMQLQGLAAAYERRFGVRLAFLRMYEDVEWVVASRRRSKEIADSAGIDRDNSLRVGNTIHKFDSTHPQNLEINNAPGAPPVSATIDAKTHIYLYTRLPLDMKAMGENSAALGKLLGQMTDAFVGIHQRLGNIEQKLR